MRAFPLCLNPAQGPPTQPLDCSSLKPSRLLSFTVFVHTRCVKHPSSLSLRDLSRLSPTLCLLRRSRGFLSEAVPFSPVLRLNEQCQEALTAATWPPPCDLDKRLLVALRIGSSREPFPPLLQTFIFSRRSSRSPSQRFY